MTSEPVIRIDLASPTPAYRQIANAVRAMLVSGAFKPGDQLPTVRELAMDLGVHHNTIAEAYRVLFDEGWLDMRRRHGVTVRERAHPAPSAKTREAFARRMRELIAEVRTEGLDADSIVEELRLLADEMSTGTPVKG
jgi:GntR family transcriptional regulator